jgi:phosphoribosylformylglycinamidine synthase
LDALLFGEAQNRIVITTSAHHAGKVLAQAKVLGIPARRLGQVGGDQLAIQTPFGTFSWALAELYDLWWNAIARTMD